MNSIHFIQRLAAIFVILILAGCAGQKLEGRYTINDSMKAKGQNSRIDMIVLHYTAGSKTTASDTGNFTYTYPAIAKDSTIFNVLATGNNNDASLTDKLMYGCIDLAKGDPDISTRLLAKGTKSDVDCN